MKFLCLLLAALLLFVVDSVDSFAPNKATAFRPTHALANSAATTTETATDAFSEYSQTDPNQGLAYRDTLVGSGRVAERGNVLTLAYKGRLMSNKSQFDQSEKYSFKLEQGRVLPGWVEGLVGMRVGGQRTLRIPPSLAWGDKWYKGTIPPSSHVEFDVELLSIAENPFEESFLVLNMEPWRIGGIGIMFMLLALTPMLPQ